MWIKKKDKVIVLSGKEKGKRGEVLSYSGSERFVVAKINIAKKHQRARGAEQVGGIVDKEVPLHQSKLMLVCPQCDSPTRIKFELLEQGERVRICRKCSQRID